MIIIGYQGIGKSTLTEKRLYQIAHNELSDGDNEIYIDLESSTRYNKDGKFAEEWYIQYCNIALNLSNQGFTVFTSSHDIVREQFNEITHGDHPCVYVCYPALELRDQWVDKLRERYNISKMDKDLKAYLNAKAQYEDSINKLANESFKKIVIDDIDYNLEHLIHTALHTTRKGMKLFAGAER